MTRIRHKMSDISKQFKNTVLHSKIYHNSDCGTNPIPLVKWWKLKNLKTIIYLKYNIFQKDSVCKQTYAFVLENKSKILEKSGTQNGTS